MKHIEKLKFSEEEKIEKLSAFFSEEIKLLKQEYKFNKGNFDETEKTVALDGYEVFKFKPDGIRTVTDVFSFERYKYKELLIEMFGVPTSWGDDFIPHEEETLTNIIERIADEDIPEGFRVYIQIKNGDIETEASGIMSDISNLVNYPECFMEYCDSIGGDEVEAGGIFLKDLLPGIMFDYGLSEEKEKIIGKKIGVSSPASIFPDIFGTPYDEHVQSDYDDLIFYNDPLPFVLQVMSIFIDKKNKQQSLKDLIDALDILLHTKEMEMSVVYAVPVIRLETRKDGVTVYGLDNDSDSIFAEIARSCGFDIIEEKKHGFGFYVKKYNKTKRGWISCVKKYLNRERKKEN